MNKRLHAFVSICDDAKEKVKRKGKLSGIPITVKDNICTKGIRTTAGSRILHNYFPQFSATAVERIEAEGGVVVGKTSMDEFGFGTFGVNAGKGFEVARNPMDERRCTGGSSSGAGCALAGMRAHHIALAESTGGSITSPAAFCGVVGITPTYGLVSRWGLIDFASSCDKIGTMGKTVSDAALLLGVIAGADGRDATCVGKKGNFEKAKPRLKGVKFGVLKVSGCNESVEREFWGAVKKLEAEGADYEECELKFFEHALAAYYIIAMSEASTNLAKFCGMRYGASKKISGNFDDFFARIRSESFGDEAKRRIVLGTFARMRGYRGRYYLKALKVRQLIINEFSSFLRNKFLVLPSMPILPPKFSEIEKLQPHEHYALDVCTVAQNLAGLPHVSLPCARAVGIQIIGKHFSEMELIEVAKGVENVIND